MIDSFKGDYRFLSNFWLVNVAFDGYTYPSVENAYVAAKTHSDLDRWKIRNMTPSQAKRYGRRVNIREDWDDVRLPIMESLVRAKFKYDEKLRYLLLETGDQELVEGNTWGDTYWGVCDGEGKNHLGNILMNVRENIRNGKL